MTKIEKLLNDFSSQNKSIKKNFEDIRLAINDVAEAANAALRHLSRYTTAHPDCVGMKVYKCPDCENTYKETK